MKTYLHFTHFTFYSCFKHLFTISHLAYSPNSPVSGWRIDDLSFINLNTGWVVYNTTFGSGDNGKVFRTTDGGNSWNMQFSTTNVYLRCIGFADSLNGFIGTLGNFQGLNSSPIMYKTNNGGVTWDSINFGNTRPGGLCGISVFNSNYIFACGRVNNPAYFTKTTNGGINWITQNMSSYAFELIDCKFFTPDSGFVIGAANSSYAGLILFTSNGGSSWIERYRGDGAPYDGLWKINFPTRLAGYASINDAIRTDSIFCIITTNGGLNWIKLGYPVPLGYHSNYTQGIGFLNENTGWTGDGSHCYKTTNGGLSWTSDNFAYNRNRIRFLNDTIGYSTGISVYKFTSEPIGIHPISTEVPKHFSLEQNYPNPLNPGTRIKFEIPSTPLSFGEGMGVGLIIYNTLGQDIITLVNEQLQPGVYEVNWNASNYPSGVYYYRLVAGDNTNNGGSIFSQTKKLVLLK